MSRIYEALQRAEQERIANIPPPAPEAVPYPVEAPSEQQSQPHETEPALPSEQPRSEQPRSQQARPEQARSEQPRSEAAALPPYPPVNPVPGSAHGAIASAQAAFAPADPPPVFTPLAGAPRLDLNSIRRRPWKPQLEKLPALEERGPAVEQFRSLRTRLFGFRDLNTLKSIMVSSGLPREGKSFIAANLAVSFARHKSARVLLIDGDMRRSSLHNLFGCERTPGLTNYLAGKSSLLEIMQRPELANPNSPLQRGLGSITFIGGGDEGDLAADLAGSSRFKQLIDAASSSFDWIVVDSSPVNLVTDGVNLASACDAVLMVARGGVTKFEAAQRALAELKASKILGIVLNAVSDTPLPDGYYGYDGYDSPTDPDSADPAPVEQHTPEPAAR